MEKLITIDMTHEDTKSMESTWNENPALKYMGVRIDLSDKYSVKAIIDNIQPFQRGGMGTSAINGAVQSSLFDLVIGIVGLVNSNKYRTGTVQLNINFLKPVHGNKLVVEGKLIKKGRSLVFARAEVYNDKNELCSTCDGICSVDTSKPIVENFMSV